YITCRNKYKGEKLDSRSFQRQRTGWDRGREADKVKKYFANPHVSVKIIGIKNVKEQEKV
ncbi:MAG: hypothetical protein ACLUN9_22690, partial [Enterocloster aldenensis]